jgi:hypothetical protein
MRITLEDVTSKILPRVSAGRALAHSEWLTLVRVAECLLAGALQDLTPEQVANNVENFLIAGRSRRAWRIRILLIVIEHMPLTTHRRTFGALSIEERRALVLDKWVEGKHLWRVCSKVRNLVILGAYGDKRAAAKTGYVPVSLRARFQHLNGEAQPRGIA